MTEEEFQEIRAEVLGKIKGAKERKRVRAISYAQAVMNQRDGLPVFGWHADVTEHEKRLVMAQIKRYKPDFGSKVLH